MPSSTPEGDPTGEGSEPTPPLTTRAFSDAARAPESVVEEAKAAFARRRPDTDIVALHDEEPSDDGALHLHFMSGEVSVVLTITDTGRSRHVWGRVDPPHPRRITARTATDDIPAPLVSVAGDCTFAVDVRPGPLAILLEYERDVRSRGAQTDWTIV